MSLPSTNRARASLNRRLRRSPFRSGRARRAVSDVVATILILALTVTLFASIFAFVGSFPAPPPQNVNQFQASIVRTANQSYISGLKINHLAGPSVPGSDHIYLESANHEPNWQFSISGGIPIYWGLSPNASTSSWSFGQYWSTTFTKLIRIPDNITVYILTPNQLLYSVVLPGLVISTPPAILSSGISPSTLSVGEGFQVYASLGGTLTGLVAKVNLNAVPGLGGNVSLTLQPSGLYTYTSASGPTSSGTWYALIYVTNSLGQVASTTVPVVVAGAGGGGSTGLTVSAGMSPQPPTVPLGSPSGYFWGVVTYTGSQTAGVYVNFTILQAAGGHAKLVKTTIPGQTGQSITGPSSVTVYSQPSSNFNGWVSNSTVTVYANATVVNGVGKASGSLSFAVANPGLTGIVYFTTGSTGGTTHTHSFSHSCGSGSCPFLYLTAWDNYSAGPGSLTISGVVTTNSTTGGHSHTYTIASTTLTEGTALVINCVTAGSTTARWSSPGGGSGTVYVARLWLAVYSGTTLVGFITDSYHATFT